MLARLRWPLPGGGPRGAGGLELCGLCVFDVVYLSRSSRSAWIEIQWADLLGIKGCSRAPRGARGLKSVPQASRVKLRNVALLAERVD